MNLSKTSLQTLRVGMGVVMIWSLLTLPVIVQNCTNSKAMLFATLISLLGGTILGMAVIYLKHHRMATASKTIKNAMCKFAVTGLIWCAVYTIVVAFHAINDIAMPTYSAFCLMQGLFLGLLGAAFSLQEPSQTQKCSRARVSVR